MPKKGTPHNPSVEPGICTEAHKQCGCGSFRRWQLRQAGSRNIDNERTS